MGEIGELRDDRDGSYSDELFNSKKKASVKVLDECIELQLAKSKDYQNEASTVMQADYYPRGIESIYDMMNTKMLRLRSIMDAMQSSDHKPNFESLRDTAKDLINYTSFYAAYLDGGVPGQKSDRDHFNKPIKK